jgi:hypothetical protein
MLGPQGDGVTEIVGFVCRYDLAGDKRQRTGSLTGCVVIVGVLGHTSRTLCPHAAAPLGGRSSKEPMSTHRDALLMEHGDLSPERYRETASDSQQ